MRLKYGILGTLMTVALAIGSSFGVKYYREGLPIYKAGDCLQVDYMLWMVIDEVTDSEYKFTLIQLFFPRPGHKAIREINKMDLVKVDCKTGTPVQESSNDTGTNN